jgi:hypothetical protein
MNKIVVALFLLLSIITTIASVANVYFNIEHFRAEARAGVQAERFVHQELKKWGIEQ